MLIQRWIVCFKCRKEHKIYFYIFSFANEKCGIWKCLFSCRKRSVTDTIFLSNFTQDLQFVITLSFHSLWVLRNRNGSSKKMSIMEVIQYYHPECKGMDYLEKEDCRFLIVIDSFDCYQAPLDWEVSNLRFIRITNYRSLELSSVKTLSRSKCFRLNCHVLEKETFSCWTRFTGS